VSGEAGGAATVITLCVIHFGLGTAPQPRHLLGEEFVSHEAALVAISVCGNQHDVTHPSHGINAIGHTPQRSGCTAHYGYFVCAGHVVQCDARILTLFVCCVQASSTRPVSTRRCCR
jgi:hypothetical protein